MVTNCKTERSFSQKKRIQIQTEQRWDKRGRHPYLCSWLKQICCAKLTLRIYWLIVALRQFSNFYIMARTS
jgi:hypothetical protein